MKSTTDYIKGKTHEQLEARQRELDAYCKTQLEHTGPGESPWDRDTEEELRQLRRYFEATTFAAPLDAIGLKHGTDKASSFHNYLATYETYFAPRRDRRFCLCEIGVAGGASLRTWLEYFPNVEVVGLDHNPEACRGDFGERGAALCKDATDPKTWQELNDLAYRFDIIIDDGGHFSHQITTAFILGWPLLNSGGLYCIEDTHAVYANEEGVNAKLWAWLETKIHEMNELGRGQCGRPMVSDIAFVHLYKSLIVIGKR